MKWVKRTLAALLVALIGGEFYSVATRATVSCSVPFTFTAGTTAVASQVNSNFSSIITCLTNAAAAGVNGDITAITGLTTPLSPAQGGTGVFLGGQSTGSANAQTVATTTPNSFTLTSGYRVTFVAGFTSTTAMTLNVHSQGAVNVFRKSQLGATATVGGEVVAGNVYTVAYNGTNFVLDGETVLIGELKYFSGSVVSAPPGYLNATGNAVSRTTFADLFAVIGTTYGVGDGATTFNLPDASGRITIALDGAGRINTQCPNANNTLGTTCGSQSITVAQANLPALAIASSLASQPQYTRYTPSNEFLFQTTNNVAVTGATTIIGFNGTGSSGSTQNTSGGSITTTVGGSTTLGSGTALSNLQPILIVNQIIKY